VALSGAYSFFRWRWQRTHRKPRTLIANLSPGAHVRIVGKARKITEQTTGPMTGKPCLATTGFSNITHYDGLAGKRIEIVVPFRIEDETGSIAVTPSDYHELHLAYEIHDLTKASGFGASIVERERAQTGSREDSESRLDFDARVEASGIVLRAEDGSLRITGTAREPLVLRALASP
ncbi:MAG TPA: hypothetical protein VGC41_07270, partial [Kofleriaceae bacterium]